MAKKLTEEEAAQLSKRLDDLISSMDSDPIDGEDTGRDEGQGNMSPKTVIRVEGSGDQFNKIADNLIKRLKSTKVDYPKLKPEWADWTRK